ncbi:MAG: hypothetical protein IIT61_04065, partial [Bacteroidales bacterium]|nr:hypothetical protein [Bacteroidales bacterium]
DDAQLVNASANVAATMEKEITAFGSDNPDGWYTISSPMNGNSKTRLLTSSLNRLSSKTTKFQLTNS